MRSTPIIRAALVVTAIVCCITIGMTVWVAVRPMPLADISTGAPVLPSVSTQAIHALLDGHALDAFVPLVPALAPSTVGNPNPFAGRSPVPPHASP